LPVSLQGSAENNSAIDGRNPRKDRLEALRRAIAEQITDFKDTAFSAGESYVCPLSQNMITRDSYHVDHIAPKEFNQLVTDWLRESRLTLEMIQITPPRIINTYAK
jgi:D-tyrosyl-tRNA(Tyr) deacylase